MTISLAKALMVIGPSLFSFARIENCVTCRPIGARSWSYSCVTCRDAERTTKQLHSSGFNSVLVDIIRILDKGAYTPIYAHIILLSNARIGQSANGGLS